MDDEEVVLASNRKRQEEVVAAIQQENNPSRLPSLVAKLIALVDERQTLQYGMRPVQNLRMPVEIKDEPVQNLGERRKSG